MNILTRMLLAGLLTIAVVVAGQYTIYSLMPTSWWFHYESVEYVGRNDGAIIFRSASKISRETDMSWEDTLFCQASQKEKFRNVSRQNSSLKKAKPKPLSIKDWDYSKRFVVGENCYLRAHIRAILKYGIVKDQVVLSKPRFIQ